MDPGVVAVMHLLGSIVDVGGVVGGIGVVAIGVDVDAEVIPSKGAF